MGLTLALDFDGTLVVEGISPPIWRPYAKEVLQSLSAAGHTLILYSGRCTPEPCAIGPGVREDADAFWRNGTVPAATEMAWQRADEMRAFLKVEGVWELFDLVWQHPGKPHADLFIDDRYEKPDWLSIAGGLGLSYGHEQGRQRSGSLGPQVREEGY